MTLIRFFLFLLNREFDEENSYSVPYIWESYRFAYDPSLIKTKLSIKHLFDPKFKIATTPDPLETIVIAGYHLFKDKPFLSKKDSAQITTLLKEQKKHVEAFVDFRAKDLVTSGKHTSIVSKKHPS